MDPTFDGAPALVPKAFNTDPEPNGDILMYPEGDRSAPPSGRMPRGGWYVDSIVRQPPIDDENLNVEDNLEEFEPVSDEELVELHNLARARWLFGQWLAREAKNLNLPVLQPRPWDTLVQRLVDTLSGPAAAQDANASE